MPKQQNPAIEYAAQVESPIVNGEAKLIISDNALTISTLFVTADIAFAELVELTLVGYNVCLKADSGDYTFSRMGNWRQPFYHTLCDAYNKAVLRSLFIEGNPIITAKGDFTGTDCISPTSPQPALTRYSIPIHVYGNNVTTLPPDLSARRVPLCFVDGMDKGRFELTLKLGPDELYTYAKLGYETTPFAQAVEDRIRKLREKTLSAARGIDMSLTSMQASQLAGLMPQGAAAPIGQIAGIAPSFVEALEKKIAATRTADSYAAFKEICDPSQIFIGFREIECGKTSTENGVVPDGGNDPYGGNHYDSQPSPQSENANDDADPYLIWMIAPSPNGRFAAVEFATADSATFVYRTGGDFATFARQLNRALEAISFRREVIRLTDSELRKPENADYYMAAKHTASLQFTRSNFAGRIIHSSVKTWKSKLTELWNQ